MLKESNEITQEYFLASSSTECIDEIEDGEIADTYIPFENSYLKKIYSKRDNVLIGLDYHQPNVDEFTNSNKLKMFINKYKQSLDKTIISNSQEFFLNNKLKMLLKYVNYESYNFTLLNEYNDNLKPLVLKSDKGMHIVSTKSTNYNYKEDYKKFYEKIVKRNEKVFDKKPIIIMKTEFIDKVTDSSAFICFKVEDKMIVFIDVYYNEIEFFKGLELSSENKVKNGSFCYNKYDVKDNKGQGFILFLYSDTTFKNDNENITFDRISFYGDGVESFGNTKTIYANNSIFIKSFEKYNYKNILDYLCGLNTMENGDYVLNSGNLYEIKGDGDSVLFKGFDYSLLVED
ncbi:hypothetical protein HERIO_1368 [Hepatospora eriocheir]|uniref:Uncharacterized protein n=1 Tax=Hepatospora eriocheir TaxID=1081669 RepID=A0A1X0QAA8_9MICR|nr:hypothetical protein HERIO_1368 [Hepatospora eriocheir]